MCGIAGCYQQADGRKLTDVMTDRIAHRGPDAQLYNFKELRARLQADGVTFSRDSAGHY